MPSESQDAVIRVTADVRQAVLGFMGQRLIEAALRRDLGVDSKRPHHFNAKRHLKIYDIADHRPPRRAAWMGDVRVEWIRSFKDEAMQRITEDAARLDKIRPRNPDALAKAHRIVACSEPQLRQRAARLVRAEFGKPEPEPYEPPPREEEKPFTEAQALKAVQDLQLETLRQVLVSVECLDQGGLLSALESLQPSRRDTWAEIWTWPGTVHRAVHLLEFQDRQAQVVSDLMLILEDSRTRPDYVVLDFEELGRVRALRRAIIYEAKTGGGKLTANQEHAMWLCARSQHVEYRVVHVTAEHVVPKTVSLRTFSSTGQVQPVAAEDSKQQE